MISAVIPTLNAEQYIKPLLDMLLCQTKEIQEIIIMDSDSDDNTVSIASHYDRVKIVPVKREDFDHGKTRNDAVRVSKGEYVLFLTQDALPADIHYVENIMKPFENPKVAMVGGRQIAREDAREYEKAVRSINYPDEERVWDQRKRSELGIRAFLLSDACSAYRKSAFEAVGGFEHPILTNEDMLIAERFLSRGYSLSYTGKAAVFHSHNYTFHQQYQRNVLVGRFLKRYQDRFATDETTTGIEVAMKVYRILLKKHQFGDFFPFAMDCIARFLGNRHGRRIEDKQRNNQVKNKN